MAGALSITVRLALAFLLTTGSVLFLAQPTAEAMPTVVVNSTRDLPDLIHGDGHCDTGGLNTDLVSECTFRAAIQEANASPLVNQITFNIPTSDPGHSAAPLGFLIQPSTALPPVSTTMTINATTQPGYSTRPVIVVNGASAGTSDGLLVTSNSSTISGLNIQGFGDDGIELIGNNNTVTGNWIGVNLTGSAAVPNDDGVLIRGGGNVIGTTSPNGGNVISGNLDDGISVDSANNTDIRGNRVGTNGSGTNAIPNQGHGVAIQFGSFGTYVGQGNLISGNNQVGVYVNDAFGTEIVGSVIGLDATGGVALPNSQDGIEVGFLSIGVDIGPNNVISGNTNHGIDLHWGAIGVNVTGNRIGTNSSGSTAVGNGEDGIRADANGVNIVDNQISGNGGDGVRLERLNASVRGNLIGTDASGTSPIPNIESGIDTGSGTGGSTIGGTGSGDGNIIAFNGEQGVSFRVYSSTNGAVISNSIHSNGALGIDLFAGGLPGPTPNDPGDGDGGPNNLINFPVITSAETAGPTAYVDFDLDVPAGWHRVEFFTNPGGVDPSGFGEGQVFVSAINVNHPGGGTVSYSHSFTGSPGDVLTATATRCANTACTTFDHTSEFSPSHTVVLGNTPPSLDPIGPFAVDEENPAGFTATFSDPDVGDDHSFTLSGEPPGATIDADTGVFSWTPTEAQGPGVYTFDITVTDNGTPNLADTEQVTITVNETNIQPLINNPGNQNNAEGETINLATGATDPDLPANTLTYTATGLPPGLTINPNTGQITGTISYTANFTSPHLTTVTVTDNGTPNRSDNANFTWTTPNTNRPPTLTNIADQTVNEHVTLNYAITATDPDTQDTLTFSLNGQPAGATIHPVTGAFSWTPTEAQGPGVYTFDITVTDNGTPNLADTEQVTITVNEINAAPVLANPGSHTVNEQTPLSFTATATDTDLPANGLTFSLNGQPAGATIHPVTGVFSWTPTEAQGPGVYTFDITVTDNGTPNLADTEQVTITVNEINAAPVLANPGSHTVNEQTPLSFTATATDTDLPANGLTFSLNGQPAGATIHPVTGVFSWTPTEAQGPGVYTFDITVTDNGTPNLADTEQVTITVNETNIQPLINNPGNQNNAEGETINLATGATDPDLPANTLTYTATGLPPGLTINPNTGQITGTISYTANFTSPHLTTVTVTDNGTPNRSDNANFTWTTPNTNRPPTLTNIADQTVNEHVTLNYAITATDPDTQDTLTFSLNGQPAGATIHPVTGVFSWTPTEVQGPGDYTFDITVTDNGTPNLSETRQITIEVKEVNTAPVAVDDVAVTDEDTKVSIDVVSNDSDDDFNPLSVVAIDQPSQGWASSSGKGITYQPPPNFHGTVEFTYTVTDGLVGAVAKVIVQVQPVNDAPITDDDEYRLITYQPVQLDVLANDHDVDGDPLSIALASHPEVGTITIDDGQLLYKPENGWIGEVVFTYVARDGNGAASPASVKIVVGAEVLEGARDLANDLGINIVTFDPPKPSFETTGLGLLNLGGISLLADSFFQTVGALRVPLGFLGMTLLMVVGFGTASDVPALIFGARRRHWAVVRLGRQQRLPAYSEPGGRKVAYNYDPTATGIVSTGKARKIGRTEWLPVETPNGPAWIYRKYLTEQVDLQAFNSDPRPVKLVKTLATRLRHDERFSNLLSPEGLLVALTGSPSQIAPEDLSGLMNGSRLQTLNGFGPSNPGASEFVVAVSEPFLEAYDATPEVSASVPHSRTALIPSECRNFPYLALGTLAEGVQPWLVFFEYRNGKAWIAGLGIDE